MAFGLLRDKLAFASVSSLFSSSHRHNNNLTSLIPPLFHFSTQTTQQKEEELDQIPFIHQYLILSFGFSKDRALKVATTSNLRPIKSPDRPESVVRFLKENGLTETEIKKLIRWNPKLLSANVDKILKPRANELMTAGFGGKTFVELIKLNAMALNSKSTLPALQFWKKFVNNSEEALLKIMRNNLGLMNENMEKKIIPRMNLLREYGLSDRQIAMLVMKERFFILRDTCSVKLLLERTKNLGFQLGSGMFVHGLSAIGSCSKDTLEKKLMFFKRNFGWSERELKFAILSCPNLLRISEENAKSTMDFLVMKFGFDMRSVAQQSGIFSYSVKKRMVPRHYVVNMLKSKGLEINCSARTVIMMSEKKFVEKFIVPYEKEVPQLGHSYAALCDGKIPA